MTSVVIRLEQPGDIDQIRQVTKAAFATAPHASGTEAQIIDALRKDEALTLSLVAIKSATLIGHVAFSPVTIDGVHDGWFGLGPVSVAPAHQGAGVGSALIEEGLIRMTQKGAHGCVLLGDPNYYQRFGFNGDSGLRYGEIDPRYMQQKPLAGAARSGAVAYAAGFEQAGAN